MGQFLDELKRRNVFRVAIAYIVASWLVLQVADVVLDGIEAPAWVMKVFLLVLALGFPITLLFSWAYELTPEGIKKESDVDRTASITPETGRKLNLVTIGLLVAVVAFTAVDRLWLDHPAHEETEVAVSAADVTDQSIAVLAFEDMSPERDQSYFAEGLSEELLNVLAKVPELQVAGRTSSFAFQGQQKDLREIGEILNVAHILEGSVRKAGNRIRVTAQLIKASDGFHLYSETFDRDLDDVFAVQDEIAAAISKALLTEIVGAEPEDVATTDPEAFELYLAARQRIHTRDIFSLREANTMLDRALVIDPIYAPALAQKALVIHLMSDALGAYGEIPFAETLPISRRNIDQALALAPDLAEAHAVNGLLLETLGEFDEAIEALNLALEINPNLSDAANWLASALTAIGKREEAEAVYEELVAKDPTYGPGFGNLIQTYARAGNSDKANAMIDRVVRIVGENDDVLRSRGTVAIMAGDAAEAVRALRKAIEFNRDDSITQFWFGLALLGVADYETLMVYGPADYHLAVYAMSGDDDALMDVIEGFDLNAVFMPRVAWEVGRYYNSRGMYQAYLKYLSDIYGSVESFLEEQPASLGWGSNYLGELAFAYRQLGDEAAVARVLQEMRDVLNTDADQGTINWLTKFNEAEYAAVSGDITGAARHLNDAIDHGFQHPVYANTPIFTTIDDAELTAALQRVDDNVNKTRAELGMPPYRPIAPTEEPEERPSYVN